ncbi:MAG: helix-turn-helix domain-containing protein [Opitutales bacterium]|nr:helix-turn-helix domain-containing protein [Opitutales bacterium]
MELVTVHDIRRDLARAVREERLRGNITQKDLAQHAQVGELTVRRLESGHGISLDNFLRIALALGSEPTAADLLPRRAPQSLKDVQPVARTRARKRTT